MMMEDEGTVRVALLCIEANIRQVEEMDIGNDAPISPSQDSMLLDAPPSQVEPSPDPPAIVIGGRRPGRRKVMKKKTIKDEEGYLGAFQFIAFGVSLIVLS